MNDFDLTMRQIDAQLVDYEQAIADYAAFMAAWRDRHDPATKRIRRFRDRAARQPEAAP